MEHFIRAQDNSDKLQCEICLQWYSHLGSHIWHRHKMLAREYKMQYGLSINTPLISAAIKQKKQIAFAEDREKYLANILGAKSKHYQFKKGQYNKSYYSKESLDTAIKQLEKINTGKEERCPLCTMLSKHLPSHLYNAHGYLKVKK